MSSPDSSGLKNNSQIWGPPVIPVGPDGKPLQQHSMVTEPHAWFKKHASDWNDCFRKKDSHEIVIGCMDPRLPKSADLRYPGLGVFERKLDIAARKIAALQQGVYRESVLILQTHDDCIAARRALDTEGAEPEYANELASWWGEKLTERVIELTNNYHIKHGHVPMHTMSSPREIEAVYIDCTDRFKPSDKVANGPTVSLLHPGGIRFMTNVLVRHAVPFGNGLSHHLGSSVELMFGVICDGRNSSKKFSHNRPLTAVVIRDTKREFLSNTAQRLVEQLADDFGPYVKILPVDENGNIVGLFKEPPSVVGLP